MIIPWIYFLKEDEQAWVETFTQRRTVNGPALFVALPFERVRLRKGVVLGLTDYARLRDRLTGEVHTVRGPCQYFLKANEEVAEKLQAIPLKRNQYVRILDNRSGVIRVERGEQSVYLEPTEQVLGAVNEGLNVDDRITVLVRDIQSGQLSLITEPQVFVPLPTQEIVETRKRIPLKRNQYVRIIDDRTGVIRVERGEQSVYLHPNERLLGEVSEGLNVDERITVLVRDIQTGQLSLITEPQVFVPTPTQEIVETRKRIPLKRNQYVRLLDKSTGVIRVERGEQSVYLRPDEHLLGDVNEGVNVDEQTAVLVRDIDTGQLSLVTEPQVFIPEPRQEIVEVRRQIVLEDHQAVAVKDREGRYLLRLGTEPERAFFLDPYSELVQVNWSTGIHKDQRALKITHFDLRPKFMWYEFEVRTQDNVELVIGITFFWQIESLAAMLRRTDDAPGDLCSHARSTIIQAVSQVSLEKFLATFNPVVQGAVLETDTQFYLERGLRINAVEVRSVGCKDAGTQRILQEIIQETTNRLNRLQKQASENEVAVEKMRGEIEAEKMRGQLLEMQREHARLQALTQGEGEALRVRAFLDGLGSDLPAADKVSLFNTLRKQEALEALSTGNAQLYFTPNDVDLTIETRKAK